MSIVTQNVNEVDFDWW